MYFFKNLVKMWEIAIRLKLSFFFQASGALKRFLPLFDRVLVQRAEAAAKSKGGILIPEKAQAKVREAVVVAAGPGARNDASGQSMPMAVKVHT